VLVGIAVVALGVLATVVGVFIALANLRSNQKEIRVQRVIDLHRDLTTGEVGAARDRFTALMWRHGEGLTGVNQCHAPTWFEILPNVLEAGDRGLLGRYPRGEEIPGAEGSEPLRDLYAVLWCFERIEAGRSGGALDPEMLQRLIAPHTIWWDVMTRNMAVTDTWHLKDLRALAESLRVPGLVTWAEADFAPL
jgi:hypothetical protein